MPSSRLALLNYRNTRLALGLLWLLASGPVSADGVAANPNGRWAALILDSLESNPRLMAGQADRNAASAKIDRARQPIYEPQLGLEWKQRGSQSSGSNFEVFLAQKIDIAGKRELRSQRLESESQAVREDYRLIRQELLQTILNGLAEKWESESLLEIATEREHRLAEYVRVLAKHENDGRFSAYDVDNGYLKLARAVLQVSDAEQTSLNITFQISALVGDSPLPDFLPFELLDSIPRIGDVDAAVRNIASVAAARWRLESSRAALDAVGAERIIDPTIGVIGGKDENDNFIGVNVAIPLALRSSGKPFVEVSSQAVLADEHRYLETIRIAQNRIKNAGMAYRRLFARWKQWRSLTDGRIDRNDALLRRLWDAGEISTGEYFATLTDREETRTAGVRLSGRVFKAWIEWLSSSGELEPWLRNLAGRSPRDEGG
jgi:outer membrane protein, heavy metal efflux system